MITYKTKQEFLRDRLSMTLGSLMNLYSNSTNPPTPDELYDQALRLTDRMWNIGQVFDEFTELEEKLKAKFEQEQRERKIGRYHASELWGLLTGRIAPKDYLKPRKYDLDSIHRMQFGTIIHEGIQKLFNYEENKREIKINEEITIVCKPDLEVGQDVIELKTREDLDSFETLPDWYLWQCQAYLQATGKDKMRLYLIGWALSRKRFEVTRDDKLWKQLVAMLINYHKRVKEVENATD